MLFCCDGIRVAVGRIPEDGDRVAELRKLCPVIACRARAVAVGKNPLGAPRLLGEGPLPAVSFSRSRGDRWIGVAWAEGLGLDAACPDEFAPPYPYARVFGEAEVGRTAAIGLKRLSGYALLWGMKEAAAKAFGGGFHTVEPGDLTADSLRRVGQEVDAEIKGPGIAIGVIAVPVGDCWLALAVRKG